MNREILGLFPTHWNWIEVSKMGLTIYTYLISKYRKWCNVATTLTCSCLSWLWERSSLRSCEQLPSSFGRSVNWFPWTCKHSSASNQLTTEGNLDSWLWLKFNNVNSLQAKISVGTSLIAFPERSNFFTEVELADIIWCQAEDVKSMDSLERCINK